MTNEVLIGDDGRRLDEVRRKVTNDLRADS